MAVFMRMNELWKRTTLGLVFCLLLIHSCQGQDDPTASPSAAPSGSDSVTTTPAANKDEPNPNPTDNTATRQPDDPTFGATNGPQQGLAEPQPDNATDTDKINQTTVLPDLPETSAAAKSSIEIEETVMPIEFKPRANKESPNSGLTDGEVKNTSGSSAVFVSVLMTGLLLAGIIIGIYYFKCHRRTNGKGMKLAEESYMADEENQGNTLVSVAPLNQPELQEKPSLNGESPEGVITQTLPAATNGHSTTKTADTEL